MAKDIGELNSPKQEKMIGTFIDRDNVYIFLLFYWQILNQTPLRCVAAAASGDSNE